MIINFTTSLTERTWQANHASSGKEVPWLFIGLFIISKINQLNRIVKPGFLSRGQWPYGPTCLSLDNRIRHTPARRWNICQDSDQHRECPFGWREQPQKFIIVKIYQPNNRRRRPAFSGCICMQLFQKMVLKPILLTSID